MECNTYSDPSRKMSITEILWWLDSWRPYIVGIDSARMMKSPTALILEPMTKNSQALMHVPGKVLSQSS